ncbi:MAG: metal ABC transporter substrate-binding protein [Actinomycetaceae bacterium]|nr:metal ABC transporter substrate-binding protein [Actinomycetaceae bacterium]
MRIRTLFGKALAVAAIPALALGMSGCAKDESKAGQDNKDTKTEEKANDAKGGLEVFATTGYIADAVKNIAPDADVYTMVKPGGDPHTYEPSTEDTEKMASADVVLSNGLHMEALMLDQLAALGDKHLAVGEKALSEADLLPWPEKGPNGEDLHDPHIWNSPDNWQKVVTVIAEKLGETDSANADAYKKNAEEFNKKIAAAKEEAKKKFDSIPEEKRYLVTGHDAFNYLGHTFGLDIEATDFVTSEANMSAEEINKLAEKIVEHKIKVVFQDNLKNPQAINSLKEAVGAKGGNVEVSDQKLFADSLGDEAPVDTYLGVFEHNANAISEALSK